MRVMRGNPSARFARVSGLLAALLLAVGVATPSLAGDFYATGDLAISGMFAEVGGTPVFGPSFSDEDQDEAPAFGLALGFGALEQ